MEEERERKEEEMGEGKKEEIKKLILEHEVEMEELRKMEFNEAVRGIIHDKERVIEDLNIRIKLLTEELERRGGGGGGGLVQENVELKAVTPSLTPGSRDLTLTSCGPGDPVLVVYDHKYQHYKVMLEGHASPYLHFPAPDPYAWGPVKGVSTRSSWSPSPLTVVLMRQFSPHWSNLVLLCGSTGLDWAEPF
ncbi:hypothetical protein GWK47_027168 [Chionoecetes opilio]|uniref:Uncharacterized protein n=1 Tax=Chionoecetes opilio TaxID=41210 RepID=A0A8J8WAA8_CHIOP|nr:hypothetical protein GWK47_027168 [Chionoecetes opilio]